MAIWIFYVFIMLQGFLQAQKVKQVLQEKADCTLVERTRCDRQKFDPTNDFERARLKGASFKAAQFKGTGWGAHGFNMTDADLRGSHFQDVHMNYVDLTGADLRGANFSGAVLNHVEFKIAKLDKANFTNAKLINVDLTEIEFDSINLTGADLSEAIMDSETENLLKNYYCRTLIKNKLGQIQTVSNPNNCSDTTGSEVIKSLPLAQSSTCRLRGDPCAATTDKMTCGQIKVAGHSICRSEHDWIWSGVKCYKNTEHDLCAAAAHSECGKGEYSLCQE